MPDTPRRSEIRIGDRVGIETKKDQGTGRMTEGTVKEILTADETHPYGIKVKLAEGHVGRVKKMAGSSKTDNKKEMVTASHFNETSDLVRTVIPSTEDARNEFKEFYQYDPKMDSGMDRQSKASLKREVQRRLARAVCSFGNSKDGGSVWLGINAKGNIMGLERDLKFGGFDDYNDSFANSMRETLGNLIKDKIFLLSIRIQFMTMDKKTICLIYIPPSKQPLFLHKDGIANFYVRGSTPRVETLVGLEQFSYIKSRFPECG